MIRIRFDGYGLSSRSGNTPCHVTRQRLSALRRCQSQGGAHRGGTRKWTRWNLRQSEGIECPSSAPAAEVTDWIRRPRPTHFGRIHTGHESSRTRGVPAVNGALAVASKRLDGILKLICDLHGCGRSAASDKSL